MALQEADEATFLPLPGRNMKGGASPLCSESHHGARDRTSQHPVPSASFSCSSHLQPE